MSKDWLAKLKKLWNGRLVESAFVDIETPSGALKVNEAEKFASISRVIFEARATYFALAYQYAHNNNFASANERNVWLLHAKGTSFRGISEQLGVAMPYVARVVYKHKKLLLQKPRNKVLQFTGTKRGNK